MARWGNGGSGNSGTTLAASLSFNADIPAGGTSVVAWVAPVIRTDDGETVSGVTIGGQACTKATGADITHSDVNGTFWYRVNPATGTSVAVVISVAGGTTRLTGACQAYDQLDQSTPYSEVVTVSDTTKEIELTQVTGEVLNLALLGKKSNAESPSDAGALQEHLFSESSINATTANNVMLDLDELPTTTDDEDDDGVPTTAAWSWPTTNRGAVALVIALKGAGQLGTPPTETADRLPFGTVCIIKANVNATDNVLGDRSIHGLALRNWWINLEPSEGQFSWSYLDAQLDQAEAAGKFVILRVTTAKYPAWATAGVEIFTPAGGALPLFPVPWDPVWLARKKAMVSAVAARYMNRTVAFGGPIRAVACGFNTWRTEDWNIPKTTDDITNWLDNYGYTTERLIAAGQEYIAHVAEAWKLSVCLLLAYATNGGLDAHPLTAPRAIAEWGFRQYPTRFQLTRNALSGFSPELSEVDDDDQWSLMRDYAGRASAQMLWKVSGDATYRMNQGVPDDPLDVLTRAVTSGNTYAVRCQEIYKADALDITVRAAWEGQVDTNPPEPLAAEGGGAGASGVLVEDPTSTGSLPTVWCDRCRVLYREEGRRGRRHVCQVRLARTKHGWGPPRQR